MNDYSKNHENVTYVFINSRVCIKHTCAAVRGQLSGVTSFLHQTGLGTELRAARAVATDVFTREAILMAPH